MTKPNLHVLSRQLGEICKAKKLRLSLAESCTGGRLASVITDVAGCSEWFLGSAVVYSNQAKTRVLEVGAAIIAEQGAVSELVAKEMAKGALDQFQSDLALSITGVAGPAGGSDKKPVGTVCFGLYDLQKKTNQAITQHFSSGRDYIRHESVRFALEWLIRYLSER